MSTNKYKNKIVIFLLIALCFALPFERIPTLEFAGFTIKLSYILGIFLILFALSNLFYLTLKNITFSDRALILFWLSALISSLVASPNIQRSIILIGLWSFVFILYLVISRLLKNNSLREITISTILISSGVVCLFGLFQFIADSKGLSVQFTGLREAYTKSVMGFPRIQSVALEPLYFANFLLVPFFISLVKYVQNNQLFRYYYFLGILILTNIILTVSRGAYIALFLSLLIFLVYLFMHRKKHNYFNKLVGVISIIVISLIISISLIRVYGGEKGSSTFAEHSFVESAQDDGSANDRLKNFQTALEYFKNKPLLGSGVGSYGVLSQGKDTAIASGEYSIVNNIYLEVLAENGLIGLLLFVGFLLLLAKETFSSFNQINESKRIFILAVFLGCFAIFIQYNFFSTLYIIYIWAFLALLKSYSYN